MNIILIKFIISFSLTKTFIIIRKIIITFIRIRLFINIFFFFNRRILCNVDLSSKFNHSFLIIKFKSRFLYKNYNNKKKINEI